MASVVNDPGGRRRILFVAPDGSRKTIRVGKCDRKTAEAVAGRVEALLAAKIGGQPVPRDTAVWLASIGPKLRDRLAAVGLVEPVNRLTVCEFFTGWLTSKKEAGFKPTSVRAWGQTVDELVKHFGERPLTGLAHADGEAFRAAMQARGLRTTTIHKRLGHARQMLEDAVRLGHVAANPWKHVRQRAGDPSERRAYVAVEDVERHYRILPLRAVEAAGRPGPVRWLARAVGGVFAHLGRRGLGARPGERAIPQNGTPRQAPSRDSALSVAPAALGGGL